MANLNEKLIVAMLEQGTDFLTIAKTLDLECNNKQDFQELINIDIVPSDPYVIECAERLLASGIDVDTINKATGISIVMLKQIEVSNIHKEGVELIISENLETLGVSETKYERVLNFLNYRFNL